MAGEGSLWHYSPDGQLVLCVSPDNRLRLYDLGGGSLRQQYMEKDHFAFKYTCIAWTQAVAWQDKKPVSKKGGLGLVALGTDKGSVSIWDLTRGVVAVKLGEGQSLKSVTGVAFSSSGTQVYTCSSEAEVLEWDIKSKECRRKLPGDKHGATALCLHHATNTLAVGRTKVHLVDVGTGSKVAKFSGGQASSVSSLAFSDDGRYLATASRGSRFVNVFDCQAASKSAVVSLPMDDCPRCIDVAAVADGPGAAVTVLACGGIGGGKVVRQAVTADGQAPAADRTEAAISGAVVAGRLSVSEPSLACSLVVVEEEGSSGGQPRLVQSVKYATGPAVDDLLPSVQLPGAGGSKEAMNGGVAAAAATGKKRKRVQEVEADKRAKQKPATDLAEEEGADNSDDDNGMQDGEEEEGEGGGALVATGEKQQTVSIGKRLRQMMQSMEDGQRAQQEGTAAGLKTKGGKAPKTGSLVTVLSQAVKSSDEDLLEQCLQTSGAQVISTTVRLLPPHLVLSLLDSLAKRLEKRPQRAADLAPWVRAVLEHHAAYLMSQPSLPQRLSGLYQLATRRVATLPRLLSLSGRLDLMLAQIAKHSSAGAPAKSETKTVVFRDPDQ